MKVIAINGSPRKNGCTFTALSEVAKQLEKQGIENMFGEPELELYDLLQFDYTGKGFINVLDAQELFKKPTLYATFLVWILTTLYDNMPEDFFTIDLVNAYECLWYIIGEEVSDDVIKEVFEKFCMGK